MLEIIQQLKKQPDCRDSGSVKEYFSDDCEYALPTVGEISADTFDHFRITTGGFAIEGIAG